MEDLHAFSTGRDDNDDSGSSSLEVRMIDSSTVRVHKHGSSSRRDGEARAIGRSRGGVTTKIHVAVDRQGHPASMHLTPGQVADCTQAKTLLADMPEGVRVIADKAYDTNDIISQVEDVKGGGGRYRPNPTARSGGVWTGTSMEHVTLWSVSSAGSRSIGVWQPVMKSGLETIFQPCC